MNTLTRDELETFSTDDLQYMKMLIANIIELGHKERGGDVIEFPPFPPGRKLEAIRCLREMLGLSMREAADLASKGGAVPDTGSRACGMFKKLVGKV